MTWHRCVPNNGVDLSNDTVSASVLVSGYTAHDSNGDPIVGSLVVPTPDVTGTFTIPVTTSRNYSIAVDTGITNISHFEIDQFRIIPAGTGHAEYDNYYRVIWDNSNASKFTSLAVVSRPSFSEISTEYNQAANISDTTHSDLDSYAFIITEVRRNTGYVFLRFSASNPYETFEVTWTAR